MDSYRQYNYFFDEYTITPPEYKGPTFNVNSEDWGGLAYSFGYGSLSAGHLDLTKSDKSFGTLGQGDSADQSKYDD